MRINYVLVDFENVQPDFIGRLTDEHFKVLVFVGLNQTKLSFKTANALQKLGSKAEYIQISGNGANALDFHIAYYIGQLAASNPSAYFHIISKDKGFDPLIQHLKSKKILAGRVTSINEIPTIKALSADTIDVRQDLILQRLQQLKTSKPRTVKTLSSTISAFFHKKLADDVIEAIIQGLQKDNHLSVEGTKVTYTLPDEP